MLKNKMVFKKVRNIIILLMAMAIMIGTYININNSKAENVIEVTLEVADHENVLGVQTITAEATETSEGVYLLALPKTVNGNYVIKYVTDDGAEVSFEQENADTTLQLTSDEITNRKVQLETVYDKKEVLFNRELQYNDKIKVSGYMPLNTELKVEEIGKSTLNKITLPSDNQTIKNGYKFSIVETITTEISSTPEVETDSATQTEQVEYDATKYGETLTVTILNDTNDEQLTMYSLGNSNEITIISTTDIVATANTTNTTTNATTGETNAENSTENTNSENSNKGVTFQTTELGKYIIATEQTNTTNGSTNITADGSTNISVNGTTNGTTSVDEGVSTIDDTTTHDKPWWDIEYTSYNQTTKALVLTIKANPSDGKTLSTSSSLPSGYNALTSSDLTVTVGSETKTFSIGSRTGSSSQFNWELTVNDFTSGTVTITLADNIYLIDSSGRETWKGTLTITPDTTPPAITYNGNESEEAGHLRVKFNVTDDGGVDTSIFDRTKITVKVNGEVYSSAGLSLSTVSSSSAMINVNFFNLTEGIYNIEITIGEGTVQDTAGNSNTAITKTLTYVIDSEKPVWNTTPTMTKSGNTVTLTLTATDNLSLNSISTNANDYDVLVDGASIGTSTSSTPYKTIGTPTSISSTSKTIPITINGLSDGTHVIRIITKIGAATDAKGNSSASTTMNAITVTIDTTAPVWDTAILEGPTINQGTATIQIKGTDSVAIDTSLTDISSYVTVKVDNATYTNYTITNKTAQTTSMTWEIAVNGLTTGTHSISVIIAEGALKDVNGVNSSIAKTYTYTADVDITPPSITVVADTAQDGTYYHFRYTATDTSGISTTAIDSSKISVTVNGTATTKFNVSTYTKSSDSKTATWNVNLTDLTEWGSGTHTVIITTSAGALTDTKSNTSVAHTATFQITIDAQAPVWSNDATESKNGSSVTYTLTVTDDVGVSAINASPAWFTVKVDNVGYSNYTIGTATPTSTATTKTIPITINGLSDGTHTITINIASGAAKDAKGNSSVAKEITKTITIDATAPVWNTEVDSAIVSGSQCTIVITATDNIELDTTRTDIASYVSMTLNGTTYTNYTIANTAISTDKKSMSWTIIVNGLTTGTHTIGIGINSGALKDTNGSGSGNTSVAKTYTIENVKVDITKPVWKSTIDSTVTSGTECVIRITGTDETELNSLASTISGKLTIQIKDNETNVTTTLGTSSGTTPYYTLGEPTNTQTSKTFPITISGLETGEYTVIISVVEEALVDSFGNKSDGQSWTQVINVDTDIPIWQSATIATSTSNESMAEIIITGTDETALNLTESGLKQYSDATLTVDGVTKNLGGEDWILTSSNSTTVVYKIWVRDLTNGSHNIKLKLNAGTLVDQKGNLSAEKEFTFTHTINLVKPVWNEDITSKTVNGSTVTVNLTGTDEWKIDTGACGYSEKFIVAIDGTETTNFTTTGYVQNTTKQVSIPLIISDVADGTHTITISIAEGTLKDTAGNTSIAKTYEFTVVIDTTPPVWDNDIYNMEYDETNHILKFTLRITDATEIDDANTTLSTDFMIVKQSNSATDTTGTQISSSAITISSGSLSANKMEKTWDITVTGFTGNFLRVIIPGGHQQDIYGNVTGQKAYNAEGEWIEIAGMLPYWADRVEVTGAYNAGTQSWSVNLVGKDGVELDHAKSGLTQADVIVKINGVETTDFTIGTEANTTKTTTIPLTVNGVENSTDIIEITIKKNTLVDTEGNKSKPVTYSFTAGGSFLISATSEINTDTSSDATKATARFLSGNVPDRTDIPQRQYIEKIEFKDSASSANGTKWDVSADASQTIYAWYVKSGTTYTVYIASTEEAKVRANPDSSYLFTYIAYNSSCTTTQNVISGLSNLITTSVTSMRSMFAYMGYSNMESLNLEGLTTTNVTNMQAMFDYCGYSAMTAFTLGTTFDTSKVDRMMEMFKFCGYSSLTTFTLADSNFDTSNAKLMWDMFNSFGHEALTTLNLGTKFNTAKATNMERMFQNCGNKKLTSLDLGDVFYVGEVVKMNNMFEGCGGTLMTTLDMGPVFTTIPSNEHTNFMTGAGKDGELIIYAPSSIFSTKNAFRISKNSTETIAVTRGIINPIYRPKWSNTSVEVTQENNGTLKFALKGSAYDSSKGYSSVAISSLQADKVTIKVDGTAVSSLTTNLGTETNSGNDVIYNNFSVNGFVTTTTHSDKYWEYSGNVEIILAEGTLEDNYGNPNLTADQNGEISLKTNPTDQNTSGKMFIDYVKPRIVKVSANNSSDQTQQTIVFDVYDKYLKTSDDIESGDIEVYIDGTQVSATANIISKTELKESLSNGTTTSERVIGKRYTVTISGYNNGSTTGSLIDADGDEDETKDYIDGNGSTSGTIEIKITAGATSDLSGNVNDEATIEGGFVDLIKPVVIYRYSEANIDYGSRTLTIGFDITDKYYNGTPVKNLAVSDLKIQIDGKVITEANATMNLTSADREIFINLPANRRTIGKTYTLTISNFDKGDGFDYSGIVNVAIPSNIIKDTNGNVNDATTLTVGIDFPENNGDGVIVDLVKPKVEWVSATNSDTDNNGVYDTQVVTFTIKDKYFESGIDVSNISNIKQYIKVYLKNTAETTSRTEITNKVLNNASQLTKTDFMQGTNKVGETYTLTLQNFENDATLCGYVEVEVQAGAAKDVERAHEDGKTKYNTNDTTKLTATYIDPVAPTITLMQNSGGWAKSHSVTVKISDEHTNASGLVAGANIGIKYGWSTSNTTEPTSYINVSLSNVEGASSTTFTATENTLTGIYYLWVVPYSPNYVKDKAGNVNSTTVISGEFWFDNTAPTISLGAESNTTWSKEHSVTVTLADGHSGLAAGANIGIKYGWSTSNTTEPTAYSTVTLDHTEGTNIVTFEATNNTLTGKYYLWVVPYSPNYVKDVVGNTNTTTIISTGEFWFDNTAPTISLGTESNTTWSKTHSVTVTLADEDSGLTAGVNIGIKYGWSTSNTTEPTSYTNVSLDHTAGINSTTFEATNNTLTGKYYLWVVPYSPNYVKDVVGNTNTTTVISTGEFWFDNTAPIITIQPTSDGTWRKEQTATVTLSDAHSGLVAGANIEIKYGWSTSNTIEPTTYSTVSLTNTAGTNTVSFEATTNGLLGEVESEYYLWVNPINIEDKVGNTASTSMQKNGTYKYDKKAPTIALSQNANTTWSKEHSVTVTLADSGSGLAAGANIGIKYGWSTSNTTAPTSYINASLSNVEGASSATFTATNNTLTGKYYLWIVPESVKDISNKKREDTSKEGNSNTTTIISTGEFWFDNTAPTISLGAESNTTWSKTHSVTVTLADEESGLTAGANIGIKYGWSTSNTTEPTSYTNVSLDHTAGINSTTFEATNNTLTGKYYLWVVPYSPNYVKDVVGNTNTTTVISTGEFWFDNTAPIITIQPTSDGTWRKEQTATVTLSDAHSGLAAGANIEIKYGWSTSNTIEPATYSIVSLTNTAGTNTVSFEATTNGLLGEVESEYYLWVNPINIEDKVGNTASTSMQKNGTYKYDKKAPTIALSQNANTTWSKEHSVTVTLADSGSGLAAGANIGIKYGWSTSNTTAPTSYTNASLSNVEGASSTTFTATNNTLTGKYYLWIVPESVKDISNKKREDTSKEGNSNTTTIISTGEFWFDNTAPTWSIENKNLNENQTVTVDLIATDAHSGHSKLLSATDITVIVDGEVASSITKTLSSPTYYDNNNNTISGVTETNIGTKNVGKIKYTLTLSNWEQTSKQTGKNYFEWSGTTKIEISAGTLKDNATNESIEQDFTLGHVDFIKPKIENTSSSVGATTQTITFDVYDKYISNKTINVKSTQGANAESDNDDEIIVYVDGELATGITKSLTKVETYTATVNGTSQTVGYKYTLSISGFDQGTRNSKNYKDYSGTVSIKIKEGAVKDTEENKNDTANITGSFIDCIKPDIKYVYSAGTADTEGDINHISTLKTFTVVFDITDKYYESNKLTSENIANYLTIKIDGTNITSIEDVTKELKPVESITAGSSFNKTVSGSVVEVAGTTVIGQRYTLELSNLDKGQGIDYSGVVTIELKTGIMQDTSGNTNIGTTLTSGINLVNGSTSGTEKVVDVVDPIWKLETGSVSINYSTQTVTATLVAEDKYLDTTNTTLVADNITVYVDGEQADSIGKAVDLKETGTTTKKYTLTLTNWEQASKQTGKDYFEWSGITQIKIAQGTARDIAVDGRYNTSKDTTLTLGQVDVIKPKIEQVSQEVTGQNQQIVFNVYDKYLNTTKNVETSDLEVYINNEIITGVTVRIDSITNIEKTVPTIVGNATRVIGKTYTITVLGFSSTGTTSYSLVDVDEDGTPDYIDGNGNASGTVTVKVKEGAVKDTSDNVNTDTTLEGSNIDFTKPVVIYRYSQTDINRDDKKLTIKFDITDKQYVSSTLSANNLTIYLNKGTTSENKLWENGAKKTDVDVNIQITDRKIFVGDTEKERTIGKTCTITISNWYHEFAENRIYEDYSGIVTVEIPENAVKDNMDLGNVATTLTTGIDITPTGTNQPVETDFVKPVWASSAPYTIDETNKTSTFTITCTDKYLYQSTLTTDKITVKVDGEEADSITKTLSEPTFYDENGSQVTENVSVNDMRTKNVVKIVYTLTLSNWEQASKQEGKDYFEWSGTPTITIAAGVITDRTYIGNDSSGNATYYNNSSEEKTYGGSYTDFVAPNPVDFSASNVLDGAEYNIQIREFYVYDKYISTDLIEVGDIKVYISDDTNGTNKTDITSKVIRPDLDVGEDKTFTVTPQTATVNGTSKTVGHKYELKLRNFKANGYSGYVTVEIEKSVTKDEAGNTLNEDLELQAYFIDPIAPVLADGTAENELVGAEYDKQIRTFTLTEQYMGTDHVAVGDIKVYISDDTNGTNKTEITNTVTKVLDPETSGIVTTYTLTLTNFKANGYSGYVTVEIDAGAATDANKTGELTTGKPEDNALGSNALTLQTYFIDPIAPVLEDGTAVNELVEAEYDKQIRTFTLTEKYMGTDHVAVGDIKVYLKDTAGATTKTDITDKVLTQESQLEVDEPTSDYKYLYTLTLTNFKANGLSGYVTVEIDAGAATDANKRFEGLTPEEIEELTPEEIEELTPEDNALGSNVLTLQTYFIDPIKPTITKVSSSVNSENKTQTITFDVYDKYLDTTQNVEASEITVYVDGEQADSVVKTISSVEPVEGGLRHTLVLSNFEQGTRNSKDYKDWSGTVSIKIASNAVTDVNKTGEKFEELTPEKIEELTQEEIDELKQKPEDNALGNVETTIEGSFNDFINPNLTYTFADSDIDRTGDTYKMTFDITDKYYKEGVLSISDIEHININNGKQEVDLNDISAVTKAFRVEQKNASNVNYTEQNGTLTTNKESIQIGHTYTLTLSNLDQAFIATGDTTVNYSGVITIVIKAGVIKDRGPTGNNSAPNTNTGATITSGITVKSDSSTEGSQKVVDLVKPIWTAKSTTAYGHDGTAEITVQGTDNYFKDGNSADTQLSADEIEVWVDGSKTTITLNVTNVTKVADLTETRTVNGVTYDDVRYGVEYKITLNGENVYSSEANQVKIKIKENAIVDQYGNGNIATEMIVYNVLRVAEAGTSGDKTHVFLNGPTSIQRQYIEQVIFENGISNAKTAGYITTDAVGNITGITNTDKCWDVSAQGDKSIIAWTTNTSAPYTVHIGSKWEIFANRDSSLLFKQIGNNSACTATEVIVNLDKLNVASVTNMENMFRHCGHEAMTTFSLGTKFDTSNVTNMKGMFNYIGHQKLETLDLSSGTEATNTKQFNTSNVTDMQSMFYCAGQDELEEFNLGNNFDTSNVTNMQEMFYDLGQIKLQELNLGDKFDTSKVTNMKLMFSYAGKAEMTQLILGDNFDTSNVTNMESMFELTGGKLTELNLGSKFNTSKVKYMQSMFSETAKISTTFTGINLGSQFNTSSVENMNKMFYKLGTASTAFTTLDLGDQFDTSKVTDMSNMFESCGSAGMTTLDLGPLFTNIPSANTNMFTNTGKSEQCTIYAPEAIYKTHNTFKLYSTYGVPTT